MLLDCKGASLPHPLTFILVVSSSDALLVVSTLEIANCGHFISLEEVNIVPVGTMDPFLLDITLSRL